MSDVSNHHQLQVLKSIDGSLKVLTKIFEKFNENFVEFAKAYKGINEEYVTMITKPTEEKGSDMGKKEDKADAEAIADIVDNINDLQHLSGEETTIATPKDSD